MVGGWSQGLVHAELLAQKKKKKEWIVYNSGTKQQIDEELVFLKSPTPV